MVTLCSGKHHDDYRTTNVRGLVFCDRNGDLTREEQLEIMKHEDLRRIFDDHYYGMIVEYEPARYHYYRSGNKTRDFPSAFFVVKGGQGLYAIGDEQPFFVVRRDKLFETSKKDIFDRCGLMQKWVDCDTCSWHGDRCVHSFMRPEAIDEAPVYEAQLAFEFYHGLPQYDDTFMERLHPLLADDWDEIREQNHIKNWYTKIADFTFIPPVAVLENPLHPGEKHIRPPYHANFTDLEHTQGALSDRSAAARKTALRKANECTKCYFGGTVPVYGSPTGRRRPTSCTQWAARCCEHGAWTEERLVDYTLEIAQQSLKRGPFSLEDVWRIGRIAGIPFKRKDPNTRGRSEWQVAKIVDDHSRIAIRLGRTARNMRDVHQDVHSLEELRAFVPDFLWEQFQTGVPPIDRTSLAVWFHVVSARHGRSYSYLVHTKRDGCAYMEYTPQYHCVEIDPGGATAHTIMTRERRTKRFRGFEEVFNHFGRLLLFNIHEKEHPIETPALDAWVR